MKKYDNYKDSGLEWLGMVPEHWKIVPLKYLLSEPLQYGANESADNCNPLGPRYIRITDITEGGKLRKSTYRTLPYQKAEGYMLKKGDILFARSGATVGKTFLFEEDYDACFAGYLIKASCNERLLPMFLYYFTSSNSYENWKNSIFNQATIQNIGADKYCALPIPTPSSEEQKRIISFLSQKVGQIDALISEKERMVEDLKAYRSSLITETVTKGLDKEVEMKDSGVEWIGRIPSTWKSLKIGRIYSDIGSGTTPNSNNNLYYKEDGFNWLQTGDLTDGYITETSKHISQLAIDEKHMRFYPVDSIVVAMYGATIGKVGYLKIETSTNQACCVLPPSENMDAMYMFYMMQASKEILISNSIGGGQPNISQSIIKEHIIPVPPLRIQKEIASYLQNKIGKIVSILSEQEHQLSDLKSYKSSLITEAVTGKIDLRDWQTKKS